VITPEQQLHGLQPMLAMLPRGLLQQQRNCGSVQVAHGCCESLLRQWGLGCREPHCCHLDELSPDFAGSSVTVMTWSSTSSSEVLPLPCYFLSLFLLLLLFIAVLLLLLLLLLLAVVMHVVRNLMCTATAAGRSHQLILAFVMFASAYTHSYFGSGLSMDMKGIEHHSAEVTSHPGPEVVVAFPQVLPGFAPPDAV